MSLRSPRQQGFQPINEPGGMDYQTDIPLTNVRTATSTGGRKPGETIDNSYIHHGLNDEKKGFFKRPVAGRRKTAKPKRIGTDGEEEHVNGLGKIYNKLLTSSVITRYLVYVLPIALLIAIPIIIYGIINPNDLFFTTGVKVIYFWTWIEIVWLSIWISKLVSKAIPYVFMFLCGVVSSGTRKYAMILKNLEIPLSLVGWAVTCFVTFSALTDSSINTPNPGRWVTIVKNLLGPALIASVVFLIEKLVVQLISINYHRRSFEGRIKDSKHAIHLLGLLYDASRTLFPMYCQEFLEEDYSISATIEAMVAKNMHHSHGHQRSGSATPLKIIGDVGRMGDKVTSVFGNIASEITGKQVFNPNSAHSIVIEALEKTRSSEALAKRLWMSFVVEGKEALYQEDIIEVLGPNRKEEAEEAFAALDGDGNGDISLDEMIMKIVEIGRDRKAISSSMKDVGQAIGVLDQIFCGVIFIITIFIFVAFQDTNFVTTLATAGTTLLSLSFVFAATTQEFLGSCIFLFVKHPYDVGDRVDIVGPAAQEFLIVEQISLLYTVFKRIDSMKMVQVPNIVLNNLWIENITRSKAMKEQLDMFISFDTSLEDIETLRREMENFVRHPENSRDFHPDLILEATGIGNMDKLQLKVEIRHKSNWHNETIRASRRSKFMCALVLALRKVPIYGPGGGGEPLGGPTNPGYSVSVDDSWAIEARTKADQAKAGKRLVPAKTPSPAPQQKAATQEGTLGTVAEERAAEGLNARRPIDDVGIWSASSLRDDQTLGSRSSSLERKRSNDLEVLKQGLLKRESTRGRRRPGESVPMVPPLPGAGPGLSVTSASPLAETAFLSERERFGGSGGDEEADLGMSELPGSGLGYSGGNNHGTGTGYPGPGAGASYSMFPIPSPGSRGAQQQQQQQASAQQQQQQQEQAAVGVLQAQQILVGQPARDSQGKLRRLSLGFKSRLSLDGQGSQGPQSGSGVGRSDGMGGDF